MSILSDIREIFEDDGDEYDVISDAAANEKIVPLGDRLIEAAENGRFDTVKELLEKGAGDKDNGMAGVSALAAAAENGYADIVKILLDAGADVNAALAVAGPAAVKRLIEVGANVNAKDEDGDPALINAARNGYFDAVRALIDAGADINAKSKNGGTLLITVAWNGDTELIRLLLDKGADVNAKNEYGRTALMEAAKGGKFDAVKMLLDAGADADAKNDRGGTLLMEAAAGGNPDIVRLFLDKGADVNATDKYGVTALMKCGEAESVGMLIRAGADVNAKDANGNTVLIREAQRGHGHIENIKLLIAAGADADEVTSYGATVLMELIEIEPYSAADKITEWLEAGVRADMNAADNNGTTVLMRAAKRSNPDLCRFLIKSGADVNAKDKNGRSVLHYAAENGAYAEDVLKLLTEEYGADMNVPDNDGDTPAILLLKKGKYEKAIGEFGLDVNMKFKDDGHIRTPLMKAADDGNLQACQWLADRGADIGAADEEGETAFSLALCRENSAVCFLLGEKLGMSREDVLKEFGRKNKSFFMKAVKKNDLAMCKKLYEYGANVNGDNDGGFGFMRGQTPLIAAIERGYRDMCFWLVEAGADVNEKGPDKTPLQTAEDYGQDEIAAYLREHGAQLRILNDDMFDAAEREDFEKCKELIAQGADVNARRKHFFFGDETLLAIAAEKGQFEWCEWLTAHGADPNTECYLLPQPLIRAAENGYGDIVRLLLDNGADISAKDMEGKTALDHARKNGHDEIVSLLEKAVAK